MCVPIYWWAHERNSSVCYCSLTDTYSFTSLIFKCFLQNFTFFTNNAINNFYSQHVYCLQIIQASLKSCWGLLNKDFLLCIQTYINMNFVSVSYSAFPGGFTWMLMSSSVIVKQLDVFLRAEYTLSSVWRPDKLGLFCVSTGNILNQNTHICCLSPARIQTQIWCQSYKLVDDIVCGHCCLHRNHFYAPRRPLETAEWDVEVSWKWAHRCSSLSVFLHVCRCSEENQQWSAASFRLAATATAQSDFIPHIFSCSCHLFTSPTLQFSLSGCQLTNVSCSLSLINSPTLSPTPHLYYPPLCMWMWMFFRSPTGTLRLALWLVTWLLPATAG